MNQPAGESGADALNAGLEYQSAGEPADDVGRQPLDLAQTQTSSLLEAVLECQTVAGTRPPRTLSQFLTTTSVQEAIELWTGRDLESDAQKTSTQSLAMRLNRDIATIDGYLNDQLNEIIHAPKFQKLESAWRGLEYVIETADRERNPEGSEVLVKLFDASWGDLEKDFEGVFDVEQSAIFRKVYEEEYGMAGGQPFGLLIGDYAVRPGPSRENPHNDIVVLDYMSQVAAASFCPFVTNVAPDLFELESFGDMELTSLDHEYTFNKREYLPWRSLREKEDARFLGLTLPKVLMREPWRFDADRTDKFCFREQVRGAKSDGYLWGGAAFPFAANVIRAFSQTGWLADIRGVQRDVDGGGLVADLPCESFQTDIDGVAPKFSTDVMITDNMEKDLADLGFIPLCACHDSEYAAFYSVQSVQKPKEYDKPIATVNANISSMIHTMLCVSRFAHFLKVIGRDSIGSAGEARDLERMLQNWIAGYVTPDSSADQDTKARYPLREASVKIRPVPGKSGVYHSVFHLCPHHEIEGLTAGVRLITEIQ